MIHYLVLAEGGCYGNFLSCLIRSMWDTDFTKTRRISKAGACDDISHAGSISCEMEKIPKPMYPANALVANYILTSLKTKTYTSMMGEYELKFNDHLNTLHYVDRNYVDRFLTVDDIKIIYVTLEPDDYELIALNKSSKNFENASPSESIKNGAKSLLRFYKRDRLEELDSLNDFTNMSKELKNDLVFSWVEYLTKNSCNWLDPTTKNERILFVKVKDILYNQNKVLEDLAAFTNNKINETSIVFYKEYLEAQKKVWDYVKN